MRAAEKLRLNIEIASCGFVLRELAESHRMLLNTARRLASAPSASTWLLAAPALVRPTMPLNLPTRSIQRRAFAGKAWRIVRPRHPAFADLGAALTDLPRFRTRGEDVNVLYEPAEFYEALLVWRLLCEVGDEAHGVFGRRRIVFRKRNGGFLSLRCILARRKLYSCVLVSRNRFYVLS